MISELGWRVLRLILNGKATVLEALTIKLLDILGWQEGALAPPPEKPKKLKKCKLRNYKKKLKNTDEFIAKRIK